MQGTTWHGVRSQHNVAGVPCDEGKGNEEPEDGEVRGRVRPFSVAARAGGLGGGGFRGREVWLGEVFGVAACGNHCEDGDVLN